MNTKKGQNSQSSQKGFPSNAADQREIDMDVATAIPKQSPHILELNIDCFQESFDYLPLKELLSIGQTCKQLNQIVGYILRQNYMGAEVYCGARKGIRLCNQNRGQYIPRCFDQFLYRLRFFIDKDLHYFRRIQSRCLQLHRIDLINIKLTEAKLECLTSISQKIEYLEMADCKLDGNFHDSILAHCPNLKRLSLYYKKSLPGSMIVGNDWLDRKYPTLEHFELDTDVRVDAMATFLERNPNIQKLSISESVLRTNEHSLTTAKVQVRELAVIINKLDDALYDLLNELRRRGFYERLKFYALFEMSQTNVDRLASLNSVVKLHGTYMNSVDLSGLKSLEELHFGPSPGITYASNVAQWLPNLKRIEFWAECAEDCSIDEVLPFIKYGVNLNKIKLNFLGDGALFCTQTNVLDLMALNRQRKLLERSQVVTIYVPEEIYLATKWTLKETNFSLIQLKRLESGEEWTDDLNVCYKAFG